MLYEEYMDNAPNVAVLQQPEWLNLLGLYFIRISDIQKLQDVAR